ncbi:unnamed protein product [Arabidopsis thaliana]|uniref:Uncharacterized protein n=2 Tax=Arabidopsis thaliana TaxID=3702 RepID=A0A654FD36_ARATH|nr:uncharacterized protein AT2G46765 [Arabidopsis thaliana]ANM61504.1 hypothetical protein AT2G46765 [Arabidopsis thaliana]VYS55751.1 unnamed protein product [Arabidopsis thaliana]|eukprot:NP_001323720.1 hypothetical protein AT2G46765 [Arabidopsis thaliana]
MNLPLPWLERPELKLQTKETNKQQNWKSKGFRLHRSRSVNLEQRPLEENRIQITLNPQENETKEITTKKFRFWC